MTIKPANLRLGCNMKHALEFATRWQGWHTYTKKDNGTTEKAIKSLEKHGLVETNRFNMFRKIL